MESIRRVIPFLLLALSMFLFAFEPARAQAANDADIQAAASEHHLGDIGTPNGGAQEEFDKMMGLVKALRGFAVVILLIALVFAAMCATQGRTQMAISVAIGGLVLFGGFWVFAMIREPLDTAEVIALKEVKVVSTFPQQIAPVVQSALYDGLNLLTAAIAPFVVIYGLYLALAFASGNGDSGSVVSYFVGAIVAFAASLIAQFYLVLPTSYTETLPDVVTLEWRDPKIYPVTQSMGANGVNTVTYTDPSTGGTTSFDFTPGKYNGDIVASAQGSLGFSTANVPGTDGGNKACAWSVNKMVYEATGKPITGTAGAFGTSTIEMYDYMRSHPEEYAMVPIDQAPPGAIIMSPTNNAQTGHVGILMEGGKIISNSSSSAQIKQNYTVDSWNNRYAVNGIYAFVRK